MDENNVQTHMCLIENSKKYCHLEAFRVKTQL